MAQTPTTTHQDGANIDYTPAAAVTAGDVVVLGTIPLPANIDIAASALGALSTEGVKRVPKVTGAITVGAPIYWNPTADPVSGTAGSGACGTAANGAYLMGWAVLAAASGDYYAHVKLLALPAGVVGRVPINTSVAATGSVIGDAAQVYEGFTVVTAADATKGVILPTAVAGMRVEIKNGAAAVLKVWPKTGAAINALSASAAMSIAANVSVVYVAISATQWYSIPLLPS